MPNEPILFVNGAYVPESQATVSVLDHGLLYGDGVFDTCVCRNGVVYRMDAHVDRLYRSLAAIKLKLPYERAEVEEIILETIRRNGLRDAYVKIVVTRGVNGRPVLDPAGCAPGVICLARPYQETVAGRGSALRAKTVAVRRPPAQVLDARIKSLNYLNLVLAKMEAQAAGADEPLMLDVHGHVCEAAGWNVFVLDKGVLSTPDHDVLEGVTRQSVMEIAAEQGLEVRTGTVDLYHVYSSEEMLYCGTAGGLRPVVEVDGRPVGTGTPGPLFEELKRAYEARLEDARYGTPVP